MAARNEFKYDIFQSDLPEVMSGVKSLYAEIGRPYVTTLTLYFSDVNLGPPAIDFSFRLRAYTNLNGIPATLDDVGAKTLQWRAEKKVGNEKTQLGMVKGLPDAADADADADANTKSCIKIPAWDIFGTKRHPHALKICQRRHFAVGETGDEARRITIDISRSQYKIVGDCLEPMGDLGPRVEVKLPRGMQEDSLPLTERLRSLSHWAPYGSLICYSQYVLRHMFPKETHMSLPEIESKYAIKSGVSPEHVFDELFSFLSTSDQQGWRLMLPFPHIMIRTRRYHVCQGLRPGSSATIVETSAGRCSLKIKDDARSQGSALLRATLASHTTDINGQTVTGDEFARASGLTKLNEFVKVQRKVPIALLNGHGFQFTVDDCTDPRGRKLCQLEIEYIGSTDGVIPPVQVVLQEIQDIGRTMLASPLGAFLASTHVTKHAFFAKDVEKSQDRVWSNKDAIAGHDLKQNTTPIAITAHK